MRRQGFVCREDRGRGRIYYKLRFRHAGRQTVRYIGRDQALAEQVQRELEELQKVTRLDRELRRLQRQARTTLRDSKSRLAPLLSGAGFAFHGFAIRQKLQHPGNSTVTEQGAEQDTEQEHDQQPVRADHRAGHHAGQQEDQQERDDHERA